MRKSEYKRTENKNAGVQDRLRYKGIYCISNGWIKWAKWYMNRSQRRKESKRVMKIIKLGDKDKLKETKHFLCKYCGCEFEVDKVEYSSGNQYNETYYYHPCPTCGKNVYSD